MCVLCKCDMCLCGVRVPECIVWLCLCKCGEREYVIMNEGVFYLSVCMCGSVSLDSVHLCRM